MRKSHWKRPFPLYPLLAGLIIVIAMLVRLFLTYQGWPQTNSDESTMGLIARHIAFNGEHPLVFYGQDYMGIGEAYVGALFFQFLGSTIFALRLGLIVIFVVFLIGMYILTTTLYNRPLAVLTVLLLSVGPYEVIFRQLMATGGYPEGLVFAIILLLFAYWLARQRLLQTNAHAEKWRYGYYLLWGVVAGLSVWSDLLMIPFVLTIGLFLVIFCQRTKQDWSRIPLVLLLSFVIGFSPCIINKVFAPPIPSGLQVIPIGQQQQNINKPKYTNDLGKAVKPPTIVEQIEGTILVSLPVSTGANAFCHLTADQAWPLSQQMSPYAVRCTAEHGIWGLVLIVLWCVACLLTLRRLMRLWVQPRSQEEGLAALRHSMLLTILICTGGTFLLYMFSASPAVVPWSSTRYLTGLFIATPVVLSPLWYAYYPFKYLKRWLNPIVFGIKYVVLLFALLVLLQGTVNTFKQIPGAQGGERQQQGFMTHLLQKNIVHIYSDYWTCNRTIFESNEQIICSVLDDQLQPGLNRYTPYAKTVASDKGASYAFHVASTPAKVFESHVNTRRYQRYIINGYVVYQPRLSR
ncbi:ArnT family glycosyltransferase [Tengunoibacter tsumagoiensis]|uniref:Glycosyltransferase RgtA/B/C/D-like domain-containing protein n=1 Tax=Tengunoibacter tsumagoiensis TaxID=2014871 RepID=A0A401ZW07_9CHLR|nr:glycosyltransferase family 39 protein [Tengunoibacter tsumagoiensis]GCE10972.1 hypothetical protein KTT_08310 [Tengunoibacter tsumagoiensis]